MRLSSEAHQALTFLLAKIPTTECAMLTASQIVAVFNWEEGFAVQKIFYDPRWTNTRLGASIIVDTFPEARQPVLRLVADESTVVVLDEPTDNQYMPVRGVRWREVSWIPDLSLFQPSDDIAHGYNVMP